VPVVDDARVSDREIERRVCRLTSLDPGGQVVTGNQVKARAAATLTVRHTAECTGTSLGHALAAMSRVPGQHDARLAV
jgi:hypothetical protein